MRRSAILLAILLVVASLVGATPIPVVPDQCVVGCATIDTGNGAYYSDASNVNVTFRYKVPNYQTIGTIGGLTVTYSVFDDSYGDPAGARGEKGNIVLIGQGDGDTLSIVLDTFNQVQLNGTTSTNPYTHSVPVTDAATLAELQSYIESHNGTFRIRVHNANANGDYDIGSVLVSMDAASAAVPEPATFALIGAGLLGLALVRKRASQ